MISDRPPFEAPARVPADWSSSKPETVAKPTWFPAALAFGVTLTAWGLIASAIVLGMGLAVVVLSVGGWIGDICDERRQN